ncbi:Serine/threonine protein phosphatase [Handroanthus impetiginosus]|uniref:Serine/threonine protein phosphatase n=1 Tax=Handroanthus impetiginosus TaxID=429701 RepID=A0A2G9GSZ7_9LAMI|nr:Serine/threonine protein phosphatase [Handroanthus impetiginosus]
MVQFNTIFNTLSKNISSRPGKKSRLGVGRKAATDLAKEAKRNELLLTSSGAINARNCKTFTAGYSKRGKKGINQDCFVVWEEFGCQEDMVLCGVFDGHGPWGHFVAKTVRELMPSLLLCNWQETVALNAENRDYNLRQDTEHIQFDIWKQSCYKTCAAVDQELLRHSGIDSFYSGSTALALVRQGDLMTIASVGDSRAVLAMISEDGSLLATQLTVDQKPNLPRESKRITQSGGRVYCCPDEPGVQRVWMPDGETVKGPGLAVSRAFGDYYIKDFGLISDPEITQRKISSRDQFAILATDGVWDVISNQEAVEIVASTAERAESAKILVEYAVSAWKQRGKNAVMDDISAVCLFFHDAITADQEVYDTKMNQKIM